MQHVRFAQAKSSLNLPVSLARLSNIGSPMVKTKAVLTAWQEVDVFGGTSLSTPMFSAVWAIANQAAAQHGQGLLGQAAPLLYQLPRSAIIDVNVPASAASNNVTGTIFDPPTPPQHFSADALATPQEPTRQYVSALFHSPTSTRWDVLTFGTDSSLSTNP